MHAVRFQSTLPRRERRCPSRPPSSGRYFNPRSREGSDSTTASRRSRDSHFNPRSREGSDPAPPRCRHLHHSISIHAPAKGATWSCGRTADHSYFNPRSREGSDGSIIRLFYYQGNFNPRSREGSDASTGKSSGVIGNFNPRSREGSDALIAQVPALLTVFQSTLPRRERPQYS